MRTLIAALPFALASAQTPVGSLCDGPARPLAPSRDLYCIELIPAPRIVGVSGRVYAVGSEARGGLLRQ